jgi:Flp pilus assembly pilin Flp
MLMRFREWHNDDAGQGAPEYALLLAGVVVLVILATTLYDGEITSLFTSIGGYMNNFFAGR